MIAFIQKWVKAGVFLAEQLFHTPVSAGVLSRARAPLMTFRTSFPHESTTEGGSCLEYNIKKSVVSGKERNSHE
jgi:hypothetical protein